MGDDTLLQSLIQTRSREAFGQIVLRYTGLVYGAAYRQVGPGGLAEEVTQAVFLLLWQRPATVRGGAGLAGWLVNAARLAALAARRQESRRRIREQLVAAMKSQTTTLDDDTPDLSGLLDQALARLSEFDRSAIALRYLQDQSIGQVAAALGVSEAAASKRVARALGRLRRHFGRSGAVLSSTALGAALVSQATLAPPTALAATIAAAGPSASVAVTALVKGASTMLTLLKLKLTAAVAAAVVVLGTVGIVVHRALAENPAPAAPAAPVAQAPATSTAPSTQEAAERLRALLPSGAEIELVAVSHYPDNGGPWWRPDGVLLDAPPLDPSDSDVTSFRDPKVRRVQLVFRLSGKAAKPGWESQIRRPDDGGIAWCGRRSKGGQYAAELSVVAVLVPADSRTISLDLLVAAGPWEKVAVTDGSRPQGPLDAAREAPNFTDSTTLITARVADGLDAQVIAADDGGALHTARPAGVRKVDGTAENEFLFSRIAPARLKSFTLQTRPYELIHLKEIATDAGPRTDARLTAGAATQPTGYVYGPVITRLVNNWNTPDDCALDLDTGILCTRPDGVRNTPEYPNKEQGWWRDRQADLRVGAVGAAPGDEAKLPPLMLQGLDMGVVRVDEAVWKGSAHDIAAQALKATWQNADAIDLGSLGQTVAAMLPKSGLPAYYAFRTRDDSLGILSIVEYIKDGDTGGAVRIQYRMVYPRDDVPWGDAVNGLRCRLMPQSQRVPAGEKVLLTYQLRNDGQTAVRFLPWFTPLEGITGHIFEVVGPDGKKVDYRGASASRVPPTRDSFITVEPGQTCSRRVVLRRDHYDMSQPGRYTITTKVVRAPHDTVDRFYEGDAAKIAENPEHVWSGQIGSNAVVVETMPAPDVRGRDGDDR